MTTEGQPAAPNGAQDLVTVTAQFSAAGGASASLTATDRTTVGLPSGLVLRKSVDKSSAEPGELLVYTIAYRNDGAAPIPQLVIADATPKYTTFVPASATERRQSPHLQVWRACAAWYARALASIGERAQGCEESPCPTNRPTGERVSARPSRSKRSARQR